MIKLKELAKNFVLHGGLFYQRVLRHGKEVELHVVPDAMRNSLVIRYHDLSSHFGLDETEEKISAFTFQK